MLDFGAAKNELSLHTHSSAAILKPGFAPLEQYSPTGNQGPWTDIYAMAATIYRAITGYVPPDAPDRLTGTQLQLPSAFGIKIPKTAENALTKALAMQPEARYQNIAEFRTALHSERKNLNDPDNIPQVQKTNGNVKKGQQKTRSLSVKQWLIPLLILILIAVVSIPTAISFFAYQKGLAAIGADDPETAASYQKQIILFFSSPLQKAICSEGDSKFTLKQYAYAVNYYEHGRCEVDYCKLGNTVLKEDGFASANAYYTFGDCQTAICTSAENELGEDGLQILNDMNCSSENFCVYAKNLFSANNPKEALNMFLGNSCDVDYCSLADELFASGEKDIALKYYQSGNCSEQICEKADVLMQQADKTAIDYYNPGSCNREAACEYGLELAKNGETDQTNSFFAAGYCNMDLCQMADSILQENPEIARTLAGTGNCISVLQKFHRQNRIYIDTSNITGVRSDGTLLRQNKDTSKTEYLDWNNVVAIADGFALRNDGTIVFSDDLFYLSDEKKAQMFKQAKDVISITDNGNGGMILEADNGNLIDFTKPYDPDYPKYYSANDVVEIANDLELKNDGNVYRHGWMSQSGRVLVAKDILYLFSSGAGGININGGLEYFGYNLDGDDLKAVKQWNGIIDLISIYYCGLTVGLKIDGTVVYQTETIGQNPDNYLYGYDTTTNMNGVVEKAIPCTKELFSELSSWSDVIELYGDWRCVAGLQSDGKVLLAGDCPYSVSDWDLID